MPSSRITTLPATASGNIGAAVDKTDGLAADSAKTVKYAQYRCADIHDRLGEEIFRGHGLPTPD